MNPTIYNFTLDMQSAVSQATLSARKGDSVRFASVTLTSGGVPYEIAHGCYAVLNAKRASDNAVLFVDCVIKDNSITFNLNGLVSGAEGRVDCDITLYSPEGEAITSPRFAVVVYAGVTTGDDIEDTDEYKTLGELVAAAEVAKESAEFAATCAVGGGAISFNGRTGAVMPEAGDYDADMVGAEPAGAAGSAVEAHDADKNAHTGMFAAAEHEHDASDIRDFAVAMTEHGAAKVAYGKVSRSGNAIEIKNLEFTPKLIIAHGGTSSGETTHILYAVRNIGRAIEHVYYCDTEGTYHHATDIATLIWSDNGVKVSNLFSNANGESEFYYVAIG